MIVIRGLLLLGYRRFASLLSATGDDSLPVGGFDIYHTIFLLDFFFLKLLIILFFLLSAGLRQEIAVVGFSFDNLKPPLFLPLGLIVLLLLLRDLNISAKIRVILPQEYRFQGCSGRIF